jgi:hypothetical protein
LYLPCNSTTMATYEYERTKKPCSLGRVLEIEQTGLSRISRRSSGIDAGGYIVLVSGGETLWFPQGHNGEISLVLAGTPFERLTAPSEIEGENRRGGPPYGDPAVRIS